MNNLQEIQEFAQELIDSYVSGYKFVISNKMKSAYGSCNWATKTIKMSERLALHGKQVDIIQNLIHEIGHSLCPYQGHGIEWQRKVVELGGKPNRCSNYEGLPDHKNYKYLLSCPGGHLSKKLQRVIAYDRYYCKKCGKKDSLGKLILEPLTNV